MQFYFAWIKEGEVFCSQSHCREDEKVFSFQVFESEGSLPKAKIRIETPVEKEFEGACFILSIAEGLESKCLFKGHVSHVSVEGQEGGISVLDCIGFDAGVDTALKSLREDLAADPGVEPLFMSPQKRAVPGEWDIADLLLHRPEVVYISRDLSKVSLAPLMPSPDAAEETLDVSGVYYAGSLKFKKKASKYKGVSVVLKAGWVQRYSGTTDITQALKERLSGGAIETFTAKAFQTKWWKSNQRFGNSGYRIENASINILGIGREVPLENLSEGVRGALIRQKGARQEAFKLKSAVLEPSMSLSWSYVQPRREEVCVRVSREVLALSESDTKKVTFNLRNLTDRDNILHWSPDIYYQQGERVEIEGVVYQCSMSHRSSLGFSDDKDLWCLKGPRRSYPLIESQGRFFETGRGKEVVKSAINIARVYQKVYARSHEISFQCALQDALDFSTTSFIRFPGAENLVGKITKLCFEGLGHEGRFRAYVTASCAAERGNYGNLKTAGQDAFDLVLLEEIGNRGHKEPHLFSGKELLKEVLIRHDASEQMSQLQESNVDVSRGIHGTQVRLHLEDLRTREASFTRYGVNI